jgi:hypothetical protein
MKSRVCLIHWNQVEAQQRAESLRAAGFQPEVIVPADRSLLKTLKNDPPAAVVISLDRLPMQGRDVALAIRLNTGTRLIPLVFAGGEQEKIARVREAIPDACYSPWDEIRAALQQAITAPPEHPAVPKSVLSAYSGAPLAKKLGIRAGTVLAFADAPDGFAEHILSLAPEAQIEERPSAKCDLLLWFVRSATELDRDVELMARFVREGGLWMLWPKRSSGADTGLSPERLRVAAMACGLVDYKVCSVDATWSGMLFTRRKAKATRAPRPPL